MLTPNGLLTGYVSTFGYGSWVYSTAEHMTVSFSLRNGGANFQVTTCRAQGQTLYDSTLSFTMKESTMSAGLSTSRPYVTITMKHI